MAKALTNSGNPLVLEHPLVPKIFIIDSHQPGVPRRSDSPLRTLKAKGLVTGGIEASVRRPGGGLGGTLSLYCSLNVDAARLQRLGQTKKAHQLAARAQKIEGSKRCIGVMKVFRTLRLNASGWDAYLEALDAQPFRAAVMELAVDVQKARASILGKPTALSVAASVIGIQGTAALIESDNGMRLTIPRQQLAVANLDWLGAPVVVTREEVGSNVILQVQPGLAVSEEDRVVDGPFVVAGERTEERVDPFAFAGLTFATPEASEAFELLLAS
jgi:hypothetical protein